MRIIGGSLKGKTIDYLKNLNTRPLKDSVKENIFNILHHSKLIDIKIKDANILDLYSGIGSFGIECISRGAKKIIFVEYDINAANTLKKNLIKHSIANKAKLFNRKVEDTFGELKNEKFNIFFLDPPFSDKDFTKNLSLIKKKQMNKKKHVVIIHREKKNLDNFDNILNVLLVKKYGRSKIIFGLFN